VHTHSISLPNPAPSDPLPVVEQWLDDARAGGWRNPNAMALATSDAGGRPAVRMVLLKRFAAREGYTVFFTHYGSRKAQELQNGHAAAVLYWAELGRQVRFEGVVVRSPAAESDAYFATRPLRSQLNAWSSEQSNVLTDPCELTMRAAHKAREYGWDADQLPPEGARPLPRPVFWGGYRLWLDALELWVEGADRFHERVRYTRALLPVDAHTFRGGDWTHRRLQP
jgi:pyridoxamine 5'-phosphate oxidase